MSRIEGLGKYHVCPVCGKTFYVTCRIEKWAYRCKVKSKLYTLCSYSCTTKAINDSNSIKDDFVSHEKTIESEIAESESRKQKKTIPAAHKFNEWPERKESKKEEKEETNMNEQNSRKNLGDLTEALFGQLDVLKDNAPGATIEREYKKTQAICNISGKIIDIARIQLEAAKMTSTNKEAYVPVMIEGNHEDR